MLIIIQTTTELAKCCSFYSEFSFQMFFFLNLKMIFLRIAKFSFNHLEYPLFKIQLFLIKRKELFLFQFKLPSDDYLQKFQQKRILSRMSIKMRLKCFFFLNFKVLIICLIEFKQQISIFFSQKALSKPINFY